MSSEAFDAALDNAAIICDLAEDTLSLLPVPGLLLAVKGLSGIVDAVKGIRGNEGARRDFMDEVTTLSNTLKSMLKRTGAAVHDPVVVEHADVGKALIQDIERCDALQLRVQTLKGTIDELGISMKNLKGGPGVRGFLKGFFYSSRNEKTITDMKDKLAVAIRNFTFEGQVSIETLLGDVIRNANKEADERVLDAIPHESAGYRCVDELKSEFLDGTRGELLKELDSWSTGQFPGDAPKQVYFLSGGAGLGKSSIAYRFCTRLGKPALGASFFFGRGDIKSTRRFFSTLAHQLAMSQDRIRPHIVKAAREYCKGGQDQQMGYAFRELLQAPLAAASLATHSPVIIVIDGLDEFKERSIAPKLLQFLFNLARAHRWIRIFITSRPEPHILSELTSTEVSPMIYHRRLEEALDGLADDVRRYLDETIKKMSPYCDFVRERPQMLEDLIRRAGGVFMFARIAVDFLEANHDHPNPKEQFELLLSPVGGAGLSDLDALYLQILISAFPPAELRGLPSRHIDLQSFLTIIALQRRAMTPEAMELLWPGLSKNYIVWMRDRLHSALLMDKERYVTPLHATFGEFLVDQARCTESLYRVNWATGHAKLALKCIATFTFEKMTDYLTPADGALVKQFINYAISNWNVHLRDSLASEGEVKNELKKQMDQLIGSQMPFYARAFGWSERGVCAGIRDWLKDSAEDAAQISLKYAKSVAYSKLWWEKALQLPILRTRTGDTPPNVEIKAEDIVEKIVSIFDSREIPERQQIVVTSDEIAGYEDVHGKLVKQIRDANAQEAWFNPELGRRS
ncbi:AAA-16 domain-containing protein [Mycena sanguinolenta]|uniref:AAA-16 domain-containing protein n=1 Tax=Mycena sanguinolenta TaxID=230812 RepID=A0A8H6X930_9AGAR|nr:AAA-16 domain-containing protein [Mycena sanguinolenta]